MLLVERNQTHTFAPRRWLAAFATFNAVVLTLINLAYRQWPESLGSQAYLSFGMLFHFATLSFVVALIPLGVNALVHSRKILIWLAVSLFTLAQLIVITNLKVFNLYHFHINGMVINLLFSGALLENLAFSWIMWLSISILLVAIIVGQCLLAFFSTKIANAHALGMRHQMGFFLTGYLLLQLLNGCADAFGWTGISAQNRFIPWMPNTTMRSSLEKLGFEVLAQDQRNQLPDTSDGLKYPASPMQCATTNPKSILLLVVDSLRFDQLTPEVMPNTYRLTSQGLWFQNHYSTSNATRYGLFSLMYGLTGSYWKPMLKAERGSVLFDTTLKFNYQHFIYGSSKLTFPEFDRTVFSALRDQLQAGKHRNSADNDRDITERFIQDLNRLPAQQPFFGFLFFDASHGFSLPRNYPHRFEPMLKRVNYLNLNNDFNPTPFLNLYKTTTHYIDSLIQQIMDELAKQQRLANTIVIITSDHGQEFNETRKNYWGHNSNFSAWQTKVPLLILWPGKAPAISTRLSSHEDLVPSLLTDAFACNNPTSDYSTGELLMTATADTAEPHPTRGLLMESWTDRAILYDNHLYLIDPLGDIDPVDQNYNPMDNQELPPAILARTIEQMSRFLNSK